jgi:phage antirepressor YoqD-like protein
MNNLAPMTLNIKLGASQQPKITVDATKGIIKWGANNSFPTEKLLYWYENCSIHGAICKGKARYLAGTKMTTKQEINPEFLKANPFESLHSVDKKIKLDKVISGGFFMKIVSNPFGVPIQFYHLDFAKCRISDCQEYVMFSDNWKDLFRNPIVSFPIWREGLVGTSVYVHKDYAPTGSKITGAYAKQEYEPCMQAVDTYARISIFFNALVRNNFSVGTIVTIKNGEKDKKAKEEIANRLKGEHGGEENAGKPIIIFTTAGESSTEVVTLNANDLDKQYAEMTKNLIQDIISGHNVSGILFKIKTDGQLGGRTEIIEAHELFLNEYVKVEQVPFNEMWDKFYELRYGVDPEFGVEQVQPIGPELDLTNANVVNALNTVNPNIIPQYIIEKFGIKVPEAADGQPSVITQSNDNLKNLTGRQFQGMFRIVNKYNQKKITQSQAVLMLTQGFSMTEGQALKFLVENDEDPADDGQTLPIQQSAQTVDVDRNKLFFNLFAKYAHDIQDDEILSEISVQFAVKDLRSSIFELLKTNPGMKIGEIAKSLDVTISEVKSEINFLTEKNLIVKDGGTYSPSEAELEKGTTEIYTEYVYGLREDQIGTPLVLPTTREFCKDLVTLTKTKALTYEQIQMMENEFGESVWDFRGGFYNNGKTTTPFCRHVFKAVTKIRRKK